MKRHTSVALFSGVALAMTLGAVGCDERSQQGTGGTGESGMPPPEYGHQPSDVAQESTVTGVLMSQSPAQGDEHTGWVLTDTAQGEIEVDISAVADQAAALDGEQVRVTGELTEVDYDSRGVTLVLVADSIQAIG